MKNIADVTGGKPIAVGSQSISGVSANNPLVAFYHGRKREVLFFYFVPNTTRDTKTQLKLLSQSKIVSIIRQRILFSVIF
jgi:hypothetical protein